MLMGAACGANCLMPPTPTCTNTIAIHAFTHGNPSSPVCGAACCSPGHASMEHWCHQQLHELLSRDAQQGLLEGNHICSTPY